MARRSSANNKRISDAPGSAAPQYPVLCQQ
jgi:hypothetical protein